MYINVLQTQAVFSIVAVIKIWYKIVENMCGLIVTWGTLAYCGIFKGHLVLGWI